MLNRFFPFLSVLLAVAVMLPASMSAAAEEQSFDFADPKGVNGLLILLDSPLEPIVGMADGISGEVKMGGESGLSGQIILDVESIQLSNETMTQHMKSAKWLNAEEFTKIKVNLISAKETQTTEEGVVYQVSASVEAMGKTVEKTLQVMASHHADAAKERGGAEEGDLLKLATSFVVTREELGIQTDMDGKKVSNEIRIIAALVGYSK